jgi:N-acetylglucosaminyl-diphospho-decaprenol L-rhamnosyltransferase
VVLFASYSGTLGGAERLLVEWAGALDGEVCVACPKGPLAAAARTRGIRTFSVRARRPNVRGSTRDRILAGWRLWGFARELRALVEAIDPELVVAWGMRPALASLTLANPVVFQHNDFLPGPVVGRLVRAAGGRAALVTAPSEAVARELGGPVEVIHPGVDLERFREAGSPVKPAEVVVVGALVAWKRPDLALEVCTRARQRIPDLRLRFVGASLDGGLPSWAERARGVEFAGAVDDVAPELARASCLLHCGEREPFGLAVLEALAAGRPAIVPDSAGPAEVVDDTCAIRYPPGDAAAAADALVRVLSDPELALRMGAAGRRRAERFDLVASRARWAEAAGRVKRERARRTAPPLEVVTVTHNSEAVIGGLLQSAARHLPGVSILVVDNASSDRTVALARAAPAARVIALDQNVGFGRACNRGVAAVVAPVTALLNPDVELLDDSLLSLAEEVNRRDAPERLLAPRVIGSDGRSQDSVHPAPGSPGAIAGSLLPFTRLPAPVAAPMAPWRAAAARRVGWAVGSALVARTETLRRLGPFDERIFLYGEDLELGLRAGDAGIETWLWPAARVLHHGAHATGQAFGEEPLELLARARREAIARRQGRAQVLLDDFVQAVTFSSRLAGKRVLGRPAGRELRQLHALIAARKDAGR